MKIYGIMRLIAILFFFGTGMAYAASQDVQNVDSKKDANQDFLVDSIIARKGNLSLSNPNALSGSALDLARQQVLDNSILGFESNFVIDPLAATSAGATDDFGGSTQYEPQRFGDVEFGEEGGDEAEEGGLGDS